MSNRKLRSCRLPAAVEELGETGDDGGLFGPGGKVLAFVRVGVVVVEFEFDRLAALAGVPAGEAVAAVGDGVAHAPGVRVLAEGGRLPRLGRIFDHGDKTGPFELRRGFNARQFAEGRV